jgi:chromosome condensin MukBEF MukE localization factor
MGLNMCRQSIVDAPLELKRELEEFDRTKDRSVLIKALIDQFLITRYEAATLVAKSKLAALEILIGRMLNMSDNMLIKTIETLSQIAEVDISAIIGSGELKR